MRAIRYYGPGDVRLDEIPEPRVGDRQVKIKVFAFCSNGICGSDLHAWDALLPVTPTHTEPHVVTGETLPIVMGHEMSGTIVEVGSKVNTSRLKAGVNVVVEPILACRKAACSPCQEGTLNVCPHITFIGLGGGGGGLSEYIAVDEDLVQVLPDGVPLEFGALMEPLAVSWHAVKRSGIKAGDKVLILGGGPVSRTFVVSLKLFGASWIALSEPALKRRELATSQGADVVYDPTSPGLDVVEAVREATGTRRGADIVFDCAGTQRTLDAAFQAVRPRGSVVNVAIWDHKPLLDIGAITLKEITFTGVISFDRVHNDMLKAVAEGKFNGIENIITRRIGLEDFVEKGIKALVNEKDEQGESYNVSSGKGSPTVLIGILDETLQSRYWFILVPGDLHRTGI
ncbi:GroES-like protein [Dichomitus squalens]|uniref:GroES-like protein n=1 Tax=Dichomitus squalens TaxID=114155 RepID=A0A4Q9Q7Z8_9APHY|nr:GroES-like protein [Dichomitus squalens]